MRHLAESCVVFLLILAGLVFMAASLSSYPGQPAPPRSEEDELLDRIHHHPWWQPAPVGRPVGRLCSYHDVWYEKMIEHACHQEHELAYIMNGTERGAYDADKLWKLFRENEPWAAGTTFAEFVGIAETSNSRGRFIVYVGPCPSGSHRDRLFVLRAILDGLDKNHHE
jgi:hypothetical protein